MRFGELVELNEVEMEDFKAIGRIIRGKVDDWIDSIEEPYLREYLKDSVIVAGGSIASLVQDEEPHDYDIYFRTSECLDLVLKYYLERSPVPDYVKDSVNKGSPFFYKCFEGKEDYDELSKYSVLCYSSSAISLKGDIQLVTCTYGEPNKVSGSFDYLHSQGVYDYKADEIIITPEIIDAINRRRLVYTGSRYPIASIIRMRKFVRRGYYINSGQILKISFDINKLNLSDITTLKRQLIGVDVYYFQELLDRFDKADLETFDTNYLVKLIDGFYDKAPEENLENEPVLL